MSPAIECAQARGGYAWWYVEAQDTAYGRYRLTLILFAGSVFSPFYAERLRRGEPAIGLEHPAVNFTLYERRSDDKCPRALLWAMNEYPPAALRVDEQRIAIEKSVIEYAADGSARIALSEETTQFFGDPGPRVQAVLRIAAPRLPEAPLALGQNAAGESHFWQPLIVGGDVEVELRCEALALRFAGHAYCDRNFGSGRLEDTFTRWSWAHGIAEADAARRALLIYRAQKRDGSVTGLRVAYADRDSPRQLLFDEESATQAPTWSQRGFLWLPVPTRVSVGDAICERESRGRLEDAPFYARYLARLRDPSGSYLGVGEYLDLDRFRMRPLQELLTFKTRLVPS